jgi:hypothetical protein
VHAGELEVLGARARGDVDDPGALVERDLVPRDHAVRHAFLRGQILEGRVVLQADEILARDDVVVLPALLGQPPAAVAQPVLGVGPDRRGDVGRQRPRRRRPDHERLALAVGEREAHVERRVLELAVVLLAGLLVLGERGAAARAPLGRAVALVEPLARMALLQEAPDVLDVRVREGQVVVAPVHPHSEALRLLGHHADEARHALLAALRELGDPVLLDLALRVEAELLLDLDLDPEALAVEAVLVALVVAARRVVALVDVLQRPAPGVVDAHRVVRRDRPVDEAEARPAGVLLAEALEGALLLPALQHLPLEGGMVGHTRERLEHRSMVSTGNNGFRRRVSSSRHLR